MNNFLTDKDVFENNFKKSYYLFSASNFQTKTAYLIIRKTVFDRKLKNQYLTLVAKNKL
jgi:hypothetical protein